MKAVVLDLFGTLTDPRFERSRRSMVEQTAGDLGVDPAAFWDQWSQSFPERITGGYGDTRSTLLRLLSECDTTITDDAFEVALARHRAAMEVLRRPRPGALDVLGELRRRGFRLALMSDCSSEVVEAWASTPYASRFDAAVMSWSEGLRKPDPRLYATAADRLGVAPSQCWYVGDGGGRELSGAVVASMSPVLVTNGDSTPMAADPDDYQPEHRIADLGELLDLVGRPGDHVRL